jgi:glutamate N-acetyltransferase / amino-acid N-acetyltransferase
VSVTYPRGFLAAGVAAGLKPSGKLDLALLVAEPGCTMTGLFTTNDLAAAPVIIGRARLASGSPRAVLVNSGQANAATGDRGLVDAQAAAAAAAAHLGLEPGEVVPSSTGVIGEPLHMAELLAALPGLAGSLGAAGGADFARAIRTTDTVDKQATAAAGDLRVGGCAKGVGMISPNLATMLAFVTTDAAVVGDDLRRLAAEQLAPRFHALTVDACTSTNDTVLLVASGAAGGERIRPGSAAWDDLAAAVGVVGEALLRQLAADAEGVTHVMLVEVRGASSETEARAAAKAVADSPLVKTAAFGGDPNPGRILQAVGAAGVTVDPACVDVWIGTVPVAIGGVIPPAYFDEGGELQAAACAAMKEPEIAITVSLGAGTATSRAVGCDLSHDYVRINGEYTT